MKIFELIQPTMPTLPTLPTAPDAPLSPIVKSYLDWVTSSPKTKSRNASKSSSSKSAQVKPKQNKTAKSSIPNDERSTVSSGQVKQYLESKGLDKYQVAGIMANIQHESGFRPGVMGDNGTSGGLFQHHADRFTAMVNASGGPTQWARNWKGQIDFALSEPAGRRYASMKFPNEQRATTWFTKNFEIPQNAIQQAAIRSQSATQYV
jgi:hypothetical protein